jgi:hypothetical protein
MFGDKLSTATAKINALVAIIAATGFKIEAATIADAKTEADALPTADAFKAHLEGLTKTAVTNATATITAARDGEVAKNGAIVAGLSAAGVKLGDFKADDFKVAEGKTLADTAGAAAVKSAVETAIAAKSAKQVAGAGHPNALEVAPETKGNVGDGSATPTNAEEFLATFHALEKSDPGKARAYFRKHNAKFPTR